MADKTKDKKGKAGDLDVDALDTLSLSNIPLASNTLKNAKLIKNSRMETAVELYNDPVAGSLQIYPEDIADQIAASERDQEIINQLSRLNSYDVYSLRASLKKLGIEVVDPEALDLSPEMKENLKELTLEFTRPLIERIFGSDDIDMNDAGALKKVFRDPDVTRVKRNLKTMTEKTGIPMMDIPKFLEEYSDVFLSVAYYKYSFQTTESESRRFLAWIRELKEHREVTSSPQTAASCKKVEDAVEYISGSITLRMKLFDKNFETFWADINKNTFEELRDKIEINHISMGSVLCGIAVKIRGWTKEFPDNNIGGPSTRAKYVVTQLAPGIERLKKMEAEARKSLGLNV